MPSVLVPYSAMADHQKVIVYVPAAEARMLRAQGKEPAEWVRALVKRALERMKEAGGE